MTSNVDAIKWTWRKVPKKLFDPRLANMLGEKTELGSRHSLAAVARIESFPPGQHPAESPLRKDWHAVKVTLETNTVRWYGTFHQPFIGADLRMHVAVNSHDQVLRTWPRSKGPPVGV